MGHFIFLFLFIPLAVLYSLLELLNAERLLAIVIAHVVFRKLFSERGGLYS